MINMEKYLSNAVMKDLYKNYFQLYRETHKCVGKLDKLYKYTTGELLLDSIRNIWKYIVLYRVSGDIADYREAYSYMQLVKIDLRFLNDEQKVSNGYYELFSQFITGLEDTWNNILI